MATAAHPAATVSSGGTWDGVERRRRPRHRRELYIDAFRGLMALVMVQGHVFDTLLQPALRATGLYQFQLLFHGSTAPGFLFASGFVAGFPRSPLSVKATVRRARRLLFVLGVGYVLHLPYLSLWKTVLEATPAEKAALFASDALHVIAVTQLFVLALQWVAGRRWIAAAAVIASAGPGRRAFRVGLRPVRAAAPLPRRVPRPERRAFAVSRLSLRRVRPRRHRGGRRPRAAGPRDAPAARRPGGAGAHRARACWSRWR